MKKHLEPGRATETLVLPTGNISRPTRALDASFIPPRVPFGHPGLSSGRPTGLSAGTHGHEVYHQIFLIKRPWDLVRESNQIGILGSEAFLEEILKGSPKKKCGMELKQLIQKVCEGLEINIEELASPSREKKLVDIRSVMALIVRSDSGLHITELARLVDRDSSSVSRLAQRAAKNEDLVSQAKRILDSVVLDG